MSNKMEKLIKILGCLTVAIFLISIPLMCGISYCLDGYDIFKWILTLLSFFELLGIWLVMWEIVD